MSAAIVIDMHTPHPVDGRKISNCREWFSLFCEKPTDQNRFHRRTVSWEEIAARVAVWLKNPKAAIGADHVVEAALREGLKGQLRVGSCQIEITAPRWDAFIRATRELREATASLQKAKFPDTQALHKEAIERAERELAALGVAK